MADIGMSFHHGAGTKIPSPQGAQRAGFPALELMLTVNHCFAPNEPMMITGPLDVVAVNWYTPDTSLPAGP